MRAAKLDILIVLTLLLGLSGCYGCCTGPGVYGYGGGCAAYPAYGCGTYGNGAYGGCVDGGLAGYDYGYGYPGAYPPAAYPPPNYGGYPAQGFRDRLTLRERIHARRDARALRREGRLGRRGGGRHGRYGDIGCDSYLDGGCDCCGWDDSCCCDGCDWGGCGSCCGCNSCCDSCSSCCSDCGPCTSCSSCCDGSGGFETYESGMIESPGASCAGGSCPLGPGWQGTSVPYSHEGAIYSPEGYPTETVPHPIDGNYRESLPVPPTEQDGPFRPSDGDGEVIRAPQASAPVRQTRWIPPQL